MNQSINLNLIPDGVKPVAKVSQFDVGRVVTFSLYQGADVYTPPAGTTLEFRELKSDKRICVYDDAATLSGSTITLETTQQMTAAAGEALCQFKLTNGTEVLATLNFWLDVQTDPAVEGDISDSDIPGIIALATEQMERAEAAADSAAADAESAADSKEDAETAATSAGTSATAAEDSAEDAEAYAIGTRNGTAVPSTDPAYHNNSKYYSDLAAVWGAHTPYIGANGNWYIFDTETGQYVDSGVDASITVQVADITMLPTNATPYVTNTGSSTDPIFHLFIPIGVGIASIEKTGTSGLVDTYTITYTDQTTSTFNVTNGQDGLNGTDGEDGRGIVNITKTATAGLVDTYTITYTDGTTSTFNVTNGQDGSGSVQTVNNIQPIQGNVTLNLPDIADVNTTNLTSGQILVYNSTSQKWENADQNNGGHVIENPTGQNMPERTGLQFTGGVTVSDDPTNGRTVVNVSGGHTIVDENGVSYPQRANLKITNATITDDSANNTTLVDITGGGGTTIVQKPTVTVGTYTYDGTAQGPTIVWATGMEEHCVVTNATKTDAGSYTLTIALKNTATMTWNDMTTASMTYEYSIAKADQTLTLSKNSVSLDKNTLSDTVTVSGAQTTLSASSSDSTVATASISGSTVTVSNVNENNGSATITLTAEATNNYNSTTATISVTAQFTTFLDGWLTAGGLNPSSYADLDAVFADEKAVRKLFTIHDAVDYLVTNASNSNVATIINNDYCAKWINLRDYALDTLYANATIAALMDTADKYFYGEWALMPQVPTMTSNTAPSGTASANAEDSSDGMAYLAFDNDSTTRWKLTGGNGSGNWIEYTFPSEVKIDGFSVEFYTSTIGTVNYKIQRYTNNEWVDISDNYTSLSLSNQTISNDGYSTRYRLYINSQTLSGGGTRYGQVISLQFYTWGAKGNVPVMTSNTAPYGEASASRAADNRFPIYYAFDGYNINTFWTPTTTTAFTTGDWIQYKFTNPIAVKRVAIRAYDNTGHNTQLHEFEIKASNDGSTWETIGSYSLEQNIDAIQTKNINNSNYYLYWRLVPTSVFTSSDICRINILQFYGRELRVSVPTMTSNTAPYGEAICNSYHSQTGYDEQAYKAFDNANDGWTTETNITNNYVGYKFTNPVCVKKVNVQYNVNNQSLPRTWTVRASNDGTTWENLGTFNTGSGSSSSKETFSIDIDINNDNYYLYYSIFCADVIYISGSWAIRIFTLQFYGLDYSEYDWDVDNPRHYLYDHGVELEEISASGYTLSSATLRSGEKEVNQIYLPSTNSGSIYTLMGTNNKVDCSQYNNIIGVCGNKANNYNDTIGYLQIGSDKDQNGQTDIARLRITATNITKPICDISNVTQNVYISICAGYQTRAFSFTELWLE